VRRDRLRIVSPINVGARLLKSMLIQFYRPVLDQACGQTWPAARPIDHKSGA
jgi:hypothetical protein